MDLGLANWDRHLTWLSLTSAHSDHLEGISNVFVEALRHDRWFPTQSTVSVIAAEPVDESFGHRLHDLLATEIAMHVWGGQCIVSVPVEGAAVDVMLLGHVDMAPEAVAFIETKRFGTEVGIGAWASVWKAHLASLLSANEPSEHRHLERRPVRRDVPGLLRALLEDTRLTPEQLGDLLGASRRTIYNWLAGKTIGDDSQSRIVRLHDVLRPVLDSRDPLLVRNWLFEGVPTPAKLAAGSKWTDLQQRVLEGVAPLLPVEDVGAVVGGDGPVAESSQVRRAALLAFGSAPVRQQTSRPSWRPREITGIYDGEEGDDG